MIDWIIHVWTRPLASWSFLDLVGVVLVLIAGFYAAIFVGFLVWAAFNAREDPPK